MNFREFEEYVLDYLEKMIPYDKEIKVSDACKHNDRGLRAVTVRFNSSNACPTLYLNQFYEEYLKGIDINEICCGICATVLKARLNKDPDVSFMKNFEAAKEKIYPKIINRNRNINYLKNIPFIEYLDLAIVFYVSFEDDIIGNGTIVLNNACVKNWDVSIDDLFSCAMENMYEKIKFEVMSIKEVLFNMYSACKSGFETDPFISPFEIEELPMYVLTNVDKYYGAQGLLNSKLLKEFSEKVDSDFFILPSSIHELILIPKYYCNSPHILRDMVLSINKTELSAADYLSDTVYEYDKTLGQVSVCLS